MKEFDRSLFPNDHILNFACDCAFRSEYIIRHPDTGAPLGKQVVCDKIAEVTGMSVQVNADTCGRCMAKGPPNPDEWGKTATTALRTVMFRASWGIFRGDSKSVATVFEYALRFFKTDDQRKNAQVEDHLRNAVVFGHLPVTVARELTLKHYIPNHSIQLRFEALEREMSEGKVPLPYVPPIQMSADVDDAMKAVELLLKDADKPEDKNG